MELCEDRDVEKHKMINFKLDSYKLNVNLVILKTKNILSLY